MKSINAAAIKFSVCLLLALGSPLLVSSALAGPRDLLVKSAGESGLWLAQMQPDGKPDGPLVTVIRFRPSASQTWTEIARFPGRTVSVAARGSQLAVLQDSGEWSLIWPGSFALGQPLPMAGRILSLASDDQTLWAVAKVTGDLPTTTPASKPATTTAAPLNVEAVRAAGERLMLFRLAPGGWSPVGEIKAPVDADIVMAGDREHVYTAVKPAGAPTAIWKDAAPLVRVNNANATRFSLLPADGSVMLWTAKDNEAGELIQLTSGLQGGTLDAPTGLPANADRAAAVATGRLRLFYTQTDAGATKVLEQKYDLRSLKKIDGPSSLAFFVPRPESPYQSIFRIVVVTALVFAMVASFQHRRSLREFIAKADHPLPAPLPSRLLAGAIDLLPMLVAFGWIFTLVPENADPAAMVQDGKIESILLSAMLLYLLYTTLVEVICGRTVGKMLLGLKVVGLDGRPASAGALVARNLLRIIELTFPPMAALVIVSPLRQRAGDIAGGTLVVSATETDSPPELPQR